VSITAETGIEAVYLLVEHGVIRDVPLELLFFGGVGQFTVQQ